MTQSLLRTLDSRGVATVTLNRPGVHNAFDGDLIGELDAAFAALGKDPQVRAVVLDAAGKSFSAGGDVAWMQRVATYGQAENEADALALARRHWKALKARDDVQPTYWQEDERGRWTKAA